MSTLYEYSTLVIYTNICHVFNRNVKIKFLDLCKTFAFTKGRKCIIIFNDLMLVILIKYLTNIHHIFVTRYQPGEWK